MDQEVQGFLQFLLGPVLTTDIVKGGIRYAGGPLLPLGPRQADALARAGMEKGDDGPCHDQQQYEGQRIIPEVKGENKRSGQGSEQDSLSHSPSPPLLP